MENAAEIFFQHFGLSPGGSRENVHRIGEAFGEVPWENLTKFLLKASGEIRPRDPEEVMLGHVTRGTGGTCYSLTETLGTVMAACGLSARPLTGHMNHGRNIHCALLVQGGDHRYILDPGYVVPGAVELSEGGWGKLSMPGRDMMWEPVEGGWKLFTLENGVCRHRYTLEERVLSRQEFMGYWMDSFAAPGLNSLHLNRPGPMGGRVSAHNGNLRIVEERGTRNMKLAEDYPGLVEREFGVSPEIAGAAWNELRRQREARG